jgi:AcrR family transcriptional regulator
MPTSSAAKTAGGRGDAKGAAFRPSAPKPRGRADEVITAAATLFCERGFDATSIQDVADALSILKGSVYYYIKSKDDLLYAVIDRHHQVARQHAEKCRAIDGDPITRLSAFLRGYARLLDEYRDTVTVFLNDFERLSKPRRTQIIKERRSYSEFVTSEIAAAQAAGQVRADVSPELAALGILGMYNWAFKWYDPNGSYPADVITEEFMRIALGGILLTPSTPS